MRKQVKSYSLIFMNRTTAASRNIFTGVVSKLLAFLLNFASRTIFIWFLGKEYLGVNGLYTEILAVLSFAELGFGIALTFALYKPVAENNEGQIIKLLKFYKTIYRIIAIIVAALGLAITPFLQYIVKGADQITLNELRLYFLIFLSNTVISYFITYKYSYINARQENYITTSYDTIVNIFIVVGQIIALVIFKNYLIYLVTHTGLLILSKIAFSFWSNKKYPIFKAKPKETLTKEEKKPIYKEVRGLIVHQFSSIAIHSTDNIIIASVGGLGVSIVGLVSNYNTIIISVLGFVVIVFSSISSGFGNLRATSDKKHFTKVFNELNFVNFWLYGFCSIAFICLIPPFITLWLGEDYLIPFLPFLLIVLNGYLQGQCTIYNTARMACGDFNLDKWISLAQAIINLVVSIVLVQVMGLVGIYIGTITSRLFFTILRPLVTAKHVFGESSKKYFVKLTLYFVVTIVTGILCFAIIKLCMREVTLRAFIASCLIIVVIPNLVFYSIFNKTKEFGAAKERITPFIYKIIQGRQQK